MSIKRHASLEDFLSSEALHDLCDDFDVSERQMSEDPHFDGDCMSCYIVGLLRRLAEDPTILLKENS